MGSHGARAREQRRLAEAHRQPVNGNRFESEHLIGNEVLIRRSGAGRDDTPQNRHLEQHAPAYQEVRAAHRAHDGTGTRNHGQAFPSSQHFRDSQDTALRRDELDTAMQLNQLGYAHQPAFRNTNGTPEGQVADASFDQALTNLRGRGVEYATGPNQNQTTSPLTPGGEAVVRLSREVARTGRTHTYEEEVEMLHKTAYGG